MSNLKDKPVTFRKNKYSASKNGIVVDLFRDIKTNSYIYIQFEGEDKIIQYSYPDSFDLSLSTTDSELLEDIDNFKREKAQYLQDEAERKERDMR